MKTDAQADREAIIQQLPKGSFLQTMMELSNKAQKVQTAASTSAEPLQNNLERIQPSIITFDTSKYEQPTAGSKSDAELAEEYKKNTEQDKQFAIVGGADSVKFRPTQERGLAFHKRKADALSKLVEFSNTEKFQVKPSTTRLDVNLITKYIQAVDHGEADLNKFFAENADEMDYFHQTVFNLALALQRAETYYKKATGSPLDFSIKETLILELGSQEGAKFRKSGLEEVQVQLPLSAEAPEVPAGGYTALEGPNTTPRPVSAAHPATKGLKEDIEGAADEQKVDEADTIDSIVETPEG